MINISFYSFYFLFSSPEEPLRHHVAFYLHSSQIIYYQRNVFLFFSVFMLKIHMQDAFANQLVFFFFISFYFFLQCTYSIFSWLTQRAERWRESICAAMCYLRAW